MQYGGYCCANEAGSHFNIFAIINDDVNIGPDIYHICQNVLNNAQVTKQNKINLKFHLVIVFWLVFQFTSFRNIKTPL